MLVTDEDAVICDFAETYHIYDVYALPVRYLAQLAVGLRDDSRIKTKLSGLAVPLNLTLSAMIVDYLALLTWFQTEDGRKNRNRPASVAAAVLGTDKKENNIRGFDSGADFEAAYKKLLGG